MCAIGLLRTKVASSTGVLGSAGSVTSRSKDMAVELAERKYPEL